MIRLVWDNLDYVLFATSLLLGFALKHLVLWVRQKKGFLVTDLLFLAALLPVSAWVFHDATGREHRRMEEILGGLAPTYARETERMGHARLSVDTPPDDAVYLRIIEAQKRWLETNRSVSDIYTIRKRPTGQNVFIVDSETDYDHNGRFEGEREQRTPVGEVYPVADEGLERAFRGETSFDSEPITDRWGTWVSAWTPLWNARGKVEGVLGVDYDAGEWLRAVRNARFRVLAGCGFLALIFGGFTGALALQRAHRRWEREAMRALRRSEERLGLHLRHTPLAAIEWDLDFQATQWNPSAERIFGFSAKEAIGKSGFDLIVPQTMHALTREVWRDLTRRGIPRTILQEGITKSGRAIMCEAFHTPLINSEGKVIGVASLCQDITERRALEEELRQSQKLQSVSSLASTIAHDFNNLLAVMQGHSDLLMEKPGLPEAAVESIRAIGRAVQSASVLIGQLLAFSRKDGLLLKPMEMNPLLERVGRMVAPVLGPKIDLQISLAEGLPRVAGDANAMEQTIINLILNARDALPSGGSVAVSSTFCRLETPSGGTNAEARAGAFVRIAVRDTGFGIAPENLARIFKPFFTTKPSGKGTGLGLPTVARIIRGHRGWIDLKSTLGEGTCFELFLPALEEN